MLLGSNRAVLASLGAARDLPALLDAIAAVGTVGLHAGLHDALLGRAGGGAGVGLVDSLARKPGLSAGRLRRAVELARDVEPVLLRYGPGAGKHKREAEEGSHSQVWTSVRWRWTLIRMPAPMKSVRRAVPP